MSTRSCLIALAVSASCLVAPGQAYATANTADAQLIMTFTLDNVLINDAIQATFESSEQVGDLYFSDIGPDGSAFSGESISNPPGSVGSADASVSYLLNGLDPFVDDYDFDSFGIGDSLVITMDVSASATTPGSLFFAQVSDQSILYFGSYLDPSDYLTFQFSWTAELTGTLDNTSYPGTALALAEGVEVSADVDSPESGSPYSFLVESDYFQIFEANPPGTSAFPNEFLAGSFEVGFDPGDDGLAINFYTDLTANASVEIPEPSSLALLGLGGLLVARRRR